MDFFYLRTPHEALAGGLCRAPADDTDHRNPALTADRGHTRPRHLGRPRLGRGHPGGLLPARGGHLSPPRACPRSPVRLRRDMAGTSVTWSTRSICTTSAGDLGHYGRTPNGVRTRACATFQVCLTGLSALQQAQVSAGLLMTGDRFRRRGPCPAGGG